MTVFLDAVARALFDQRRVCRRVFIIDLREKPVEREMTARGAARVFLAEAATDAADAADLRHFGSACGIVAKDMKRGGLRDEFNELARADADALPATDTV